MQSKIEKVPIGIQGIIDILSELLQTLHNGFDVKVQKEEYFTISH